MDDFFIQSGCIGLRSIQEDDCHTFLCWYNDYTTRNKIGGIFPFSLYSFKEICHSYDNPTPSNIWFAVCEDDKLIGVTGLHSIRYIQKNSEVSILIGDENYRHKGKGSLILKLLEEYAFGTLNLHRLYAYVYADNKDALLFFENNHWTNEGTMKEASFWNHHFRDIVIWARLNSSNNQPAGHSSMFTNGEHMSQP